MYFQSTTRAVILGLLLFPVCAFSQIFTSPVKNAIVPSTAPIQPPQAFVDNIGKLILNDTASNTNANLSNQSITSVSGSLIKSFQVNCEALFGTATVNLSGNALSQASIGEILSSVSKLNTIVLNLSGGTSATPTDNIHNDDAWDLFQYSNTFLSFNVHGIAVSMNSPVANFSGNALTASEVNALFAFLVANYPNANQTVNTSGGTSSAPTGQGITDKNTLIANGWTVTTN